MRKTVNGTDDRYHVFPNGKGNPFIESRVDVREQWATAPRAGCSPRQETSGNPEPRACASLSVIHSPDSNHANVRGRPSLPSLLVIEGLLNTEKEEDQSA